MNHYPKRISRKIKVASRGESYTAWLPPPLPPDPPIDIKDLQSILLETTMSLGRLDGISSILPDPGLFLYMNVRKEALVSSQIEGTQSSFTDLLLFEMEEAQPANDAEEVSSYIEAMNHGLRRLRGGFPLSLRLIREIHGKLLQSGRGAEKSPGEFRTTQNWIAGSRPGNAIYVPPPVPEMHQCLSDLENFLHAPAPHGSVLLQAALAHHQFESIHPFLDGNGRVGRLIVTLLLCAAGTLHEPVLYLSLYFKRNRARYYELLEAVREQGIWETWLEFFLMGVRETSVQAVDSARRITGLLAQDHERIMSSGRGAGRLLGLHRLLQRQPVLSIAYVARHLKITVPTATLAVEKMQGLGLIEEITGKARGRLYRYSSYLAILDEGTEPLPRLAAS